MGSQKHPLHTTRMIANINSDCITNSNQHLSYNYYKKPSSMILHLCQPPKNGDHDLKES